MKRFCKNREGASAVEFAMLMPLFLVVVFGIVVFGSYFAMAHGVQQLAAEAARSSIAGLNDGERSSLASNYVANNITAYPLLTPNSLTINSGTSTSNPNVFVVTVNYDASRSFIYALPFAFMPSSAIVRSATIPFGGF